MLRRFRNSRRASGARSAGLLAVGALALGALAPAAAAAAAAAGPIVLGPLYVEPARPAGAPAPPSAGGCPVQIVELTDTRRAPETLGALMTFRAIQAPADRQAWLRSAIEVGLTARGFKPSFSTDPASGAGTPGAVSARIRLTVLWISLGAMNKAGSVVLRMSAAAGDRPAGPEKIYRGDEVSLFWMATQSEFNGLVDKIFADALDDMAADLRPLCAAATPVAAPSAAVPAAAG